MKALIGVVVVLLFIALIAGGMYVGRRNDMVRLNEQVKSNWAQVDVVLQRRADLIPNLVETVKGYAAQEQNVFDDIAKARTQYMNAQTPADRMAARKRPSAWPQAHRGGAQTAWGNSRPQRGAPRLVEG